MDRRSFLKMLGLAVPVVAAPKYFFAPIGGWHSNVITSPFPPGEAMFFLDDLSSTTLEDFLFKEPIYQNFFVNSMPLVRTGGTYRQPFVYGWKG